MPQHITVSEYDPSWPAQYEEERKRVAAVLKDNALAIYHIGSTSVPGLAAKPILDILAAVRDLSQADAAAGEFARLGYEYLGEFGIPGRRYLRKGGDQRTHQIHLFQADDWHSLHRHLAFRDYMRSHPAQREEYAALKKELARRFPYDIDGYCDGKEEYVRNIEKLALAQDPGTWDQLYLAARRVQRERTLSPTVEAGGVAAALLTDQGHIYTGVCIDTACSLGMCAERNAIAHMITCGESRIVKIAAVMPDGKVGMPCGACRELMRQLDGAGETEILRDYETKKAVRLRETLPDWWAAER